MLGRFLALLGAAAMAALAVFLYDPAVYGPDAPTVSLETYEAFRPLMIFCVAGLALCGLMAAFQPPARPARRAVAEVEEEPRATEAPAEPERDAFRLDPAPAATPLW
jgi:hypothetical protein